MSGMVVEPQDAVHVIGHHRELVQADPVEVGGESFPGDPDRIAFRREGRTCLPTDPEAGDP